MQLINSHCQDICGDSIVVNDLCDLGLGVQLDGCTDQCTVEDNFTCNNVTNGNFKVSYCKYHGTIVVTLNYVNKALFANEITVHFNVTPYIYGLEKLNSIITQFVQVQYTTEDQITQIVSTNKNN